MDDLAEVVITQLQLDDVASNLELRASGCDYAHPEYTFHRKRFCDVLKVTAPVEAGRMVIKVNYLDNHDTSHARPQKIYNSGWQNLTYDKTDLEGAVAFVDGFMSSGRRADSIALFEQNSRKKLALWDTPHDSSKAARVAIFRGAIKSLFGKRSLTESS